MNMALTCPPFLIVYKHCGTLRFFFVAAMLVCVFFWERTEDRRAHVQGERGRDLHESTEGEGRSFPFCSVHAARIHRDKDEKLHREDGKGNTAALLSFVLGIHLTQNGRQTRGDGSSGLTFNNPLYMRKSLASRLKKAIAVREDMFSDFSPALEVGC